MKGRVLPGGGAHPATRAGLPEPVVQAFEKELGIQRGQTTTDGLFSLKCVRCLGACGMAPVVMIGEDVHSKLKPAGVKKIVRQYT